MIQTKSRIFSDLSSVSQTCTIDQSSTSINFRITLLLLTFDNVTNEVTIEI